MVDQCAELLGVYWIRTSQGLAGGSRLLGRSACIGQIAELVLGFGVLVPDALGDGP